MLSTLKSEVSEVKIYAQTLENGHENHEIANAETYFESESRETALGLEVLAVMRELATSGMTMIVVTHEMGFAENVSDTVMIMADGQIVEKGPSAEIMRNPQHERTRRFLRAVHDR